jgi:NADH-quinone oxidoreductase subunit A
VLGEFLPILLLLGLAGIFGVASLGISRLIGHPRRPNPHKLEPYDCGITLERLPTDPFPVKFYLLAMLFIIFDVEVVFFYPWAAIFRETGVFGFVEMSIFVGFLFAAYVYVWRRGGLDWEEHLAIRHRYLEREERIASRELERV